MSTQRTISPIDGSLVAERAHADDKSIEGALSASTKAQRDWATMTLDARLEKVGAFVDAVLVKREEIQKELTLQMGRPIRFTPGEMNGFEERARRMMELAKPGLARLEMPPKDGFVRYIERAPLGTVLVLAPWNYPWLTAVNAVVPALLAGNTVILKHSDQTPLVPERMAEAASAANLPEGVFQFLHLSHEGVGRMVGDERVAFVAFTGSVEGGRAVHRAGAERFIAMGLELGGKDPAYVAEDANLEHSAINIADGGFFNSGQSCCGIERVYVHKSRYDDFVEALLVEARKLVLGDPREQSTTMGPVVRKRNAEAIQAQVDAAIKAGARALVDSFPGAERGLPYMGPQVLVDVSHDMEVMSEETFGPVLGIMAVDDDEQAVALMNDSRYGLTASVWTTDQARAARIGSRLETGTVFMNRCDYLDPDLAWTGVKDSGRGCTLSQVGYEHLTRPKSYHFKTKV